MDRLEIERLGGLAGRGSRSHLKSRGALDVTELSEADQTAIGRLFEAGGAPDPKVGADYYRYRVTRRTPQGEQTIEAPHDALPSAVTNSVKDVLD